LYALVARRTWFSGSLSALPAVVAGTTTAATAAVPAAMAPAVSQRPRRISCTPVAGGGRVDDDPHLADDVDREAAAVPVLTDCGFVLDQVEADRCVSRER
jgi:hypothetical protein